MVSEMCIRDRLILKNVNITGCEGEPVVTGNVDKIIK